MNASPAGLRPTTQGLETAMLVATAERSRRLGRLSGHVLSSAPVAQQSQPPQQLAKGAVVKEATTLPNGTVVIRFDNGRELRPTAERNGLSVGEDAVFYDDPDERLHETLLPDGPINHSREEIGEMLRLIRIDRFAEVMQPAMARAGVDMLIYVMRIGRDSVPRSDNQFADEFGARCGVFVFTTLEDGGLETAVFDHTDRPVELLGAYDKVFKPSTRMTLDEIYRNYGHELNGDGRGTELEWRFEGLGDYVREHRPTTLALNFWEELGETHIQVTPARRCLTAVFRQFIVFPGKKRRSTEKNRGEIGGFLDLIRLLWGDRCLRCCRGCSRVRARCSR
jgi:hypothetical protein